MKLAALGLCAVLALAASARAQDSPQVANPHAGPVEPPEPVDASFVPHVESKTGALELVGAERSGHHIRIRLRNASEKSIYAFRMSYHKSGASVLFCFVLADSGRTAIAPGEVYKYDHLFYPDSTLAREPLVFEAVLFEDGTGDGDAKKVKSLHDLFLASRRELEHVTAVVREAAESPAVESRDGLPKLLHKLSMTPNYTYGVALEGMTGLTLPAWKETAMGLVRELEGRRAEGPGVNVREELIKITDRFVKTLSRYPGAT